MNVFKLALIGCGGIGMYHLEHFMCMKDVEMVGFCDVLPERAARIRAVIAFIILYVYEADTPAQNLYPIFRPRERDHVTHVVISANQRAAYVVNEPRHVERGLKESVPYVFNAYEQAGRLDISYMAR